MEPSHRSEEPSTIHDAMWRGHGGWEMSLSPVVFGLLGWWLDGVLGIRPALMITFAVLAFAGSVANQYYQYRYRMEIATAERLARRDRGVA